MEKNFYSAIIFLLFSILFFFYVGLPKWQNLNLLKSDRLTREKELESLNQYYEQLKSTKEKIKEYEEAILKVNFALPEDPSFPQFFNFLNTSASELGLLLSQIGTINKTENERLKEWTIEVSLVGSYPSFKAFLSKIEKSARLIEVEKVSFSSPKEKDLIDFKIIFKVRSY